MLNGGGQKSFLAEPLCIYNRYLQNDDIYSI